MPEQNLFTTLEKSPENLPVYREPTRRHKKRRTGRIVGIVAVAVLLAAIVAVYVLYGDLSLKPEEVPSLPATSSFSGGGA